MTEEDAQHFKIIFLGDQYVGKSSILNRFYQGKFEEDYQATIGLDFHSKNVNINGAPVRLLLYDTAGQEKFKSLIPMYIRDANIILVVAGNKSDLIEQETVDEGEARNFAKEISAIFISTSAKNSEGINNLFEEIAKKYTGSTNVSIKQEEGESEPAEEQKNTVKIDNNNKKPKKKGFC